MKNWENTLPDDIYVVYCVESKSNDLEYEQKKTIIRAFCKYQDALDYTIENNKPAVLKDGYEYVQQYYIEDVEIE